MAVLHVAGGSPVFEVAASPQVVTRHEDSPTLLADMEAREHGSDNEEPPRDLSQPKEPPSVDEHHGYDSDDKRGTKRKRDSSHYLDEFDADGPHSRSRSRMSRDKQSRSRSESRHDLSPHLAHSLRTPSPRFPANQDVVDRDVPTVLLSPEVLDSKEDMHLDETSSDTVSHLLHVSPHPPSLRSSPVAEPAQRQDYVIVAPPPPPPAVSFNFGFDTEDMAAETAASPVKAKVPDDYIRFRQEYSLPPLSILPAEFQRRSASGRHRKKRDKDRHERAGDKGDGRKDDWTPIGINKWGAILRANPVWKKLSKASKCVSTHEWNVCSLFHTTPLVYQHLA